MYIMQAPVYLEKMAAFFTTEAFLYRDVSWKYFGRANSQQLIASIILD